MSDKKIPTPEEIFNIHSYSELNAISPSKNFCVAAMKEYAKEVVKYTLEQAAEKGKVTMMENCDDHTPYRGPCVTCGRYDNPEVPTEEVNKQSILSLEGEIIKDLGL